MKEGFNLKVTAIVPSLNPDEKFLKVINNLVSAGFDRIIVVNDGSAHDKKHFFDAAEKNGVCTVLTHNKNLGKGRALKTAFNHFLNSNSDHTGVVTVDGDGQHLVSDVVKCVKCLNAYPGNLILGVRNFNSIDTPMRSKFGNKITSFAFQSLCGLSISDTQTGLRAIPARFVRQILDLPGERFDYETNMLLETKRKNIPVKEVKIETVYIDENRSSHFNPLTDSLSIYRVIGKFIWSSIASMLCDFSLFMILTYLFSYLPLSTNLLIATIGARIVSSLLNFIINRKIVFSSQGHMRPTLIKYYSLCIIQISLSYLGVYTLKTIGINIALSKIITDSILFLCSFRLQLGWVFKANNG